MRVSPTAQPPTHPCSHPSAQLARFARLWFVVCKRMGGECGGEMLLGQKVFISSFVKIAIEWDIYMDGESLSHLLRKTNYKIHFVFAWKIKNIRKFEVRNKDNLRFFSVFDFYLRFFWFFLRSGNPSPHVARVFQPRSYRRQRQLAWYDEAICTWFISNLKQLFEDRTRQPELQTHNSFEDQKKTFFPIS